MVEFMIHSKWQFYAALLLCLAALSGCCSQMRRPAAPTELSINQRLDMIRSIENSGILLSEKCLKNIKCVELFSVIKFQKRNEFGIEIGQIILNLKGSFSGITNSSGVSISKTKSLASSPNSRATDSVSSLQASQEQSLIRQGNNITITGATAATTRGSAIAGAALAAREKIASDNASFLPWPPPQTTSIGDVSRYFPSGNKFDDYSQAITKHMKLRGHETLRYFAVEEGFGITTELERLNEDGTVSSNRRVEGKTAKLDSFFDYVRSLLYGEDGLFRIFVFLVTAKDPQPTSKAATAEDLQRWKSTGMLGLSPQRSEMTALPLTRVWLLTYEFRPSRSKNAELKAVTNSKFSFKDHAKTLGLE